MQTVWGGSEGNTRLDFRAGSEPECHTEADAGSTALWAVAGRGQERRLQGQDWHKYS